MYLTKQSPHGGDVYENAPEIDFSANLNPYGMPAPVREALLASVDGCVRYPDPYCRALRAAIERAEGVPARHILCGAGASELLYAYAAALLRDRPALIVAPTFSEYAAALHAAGRGAEYYFLRPEDGFHLTERVLSLDLARYAAVFLCSPNNPTGLTVDPALLTALAATGVPLLLDLSFLDLTETPALYDVPALIERFPNAAVLRSPAKSFALPGVRLGYLLSSDEALLERMTERCPCWNVSVPAQASGVAAMGCQEWLRATVREIATERRRLVPALEALGLTVLPGEANFLLFCSEKPLAAPLRRRGIAVRDCSDFVGLPSGYTRIAVRTREENDRLLTALREVLI